MVPDWFRRLATADGIATFETRHSVMLPAVLHEFYACAPLACFLEATGDGEVFLRELAECFDNPELPLVLEWSSRQHVVVGFHGHSGCVCAVALEGDDPPAVWGFTDDAAPLDRAATTFSEWVYRAVDGYEHYLDYAQGVCEKCAADPAESRRLGGALWLRQLPGMAQRLGRIKSYWA